jgi:PAS domain-containing protein
MQQRGGGVELAGYGDDALMFELAPISLWLQDLSEVKALFADWRRSGVTRLQDFLLEDPERARACWDRSRVLKVNKRTLALFEASDLQHLVANLGLIFRDDTFHAYVEELAQLWDGRNQFFSQTVNYTLSGRRLDIEVGGVVLPGYEDDWRRVLVAIKDITARESARRAQALSEQYARGLFEHSPVSLWVEDFTGIKRLLDEVRSRGISDLRVFTDVHPEFVSRCKRASHSLQFSKFVCRSPGYHAATVTSYPLYLLLISCALS